MYECPVCQAMMEEQPVLVTVCCGAEVEDAEAPCPVCEEEEPEIVEGEIRLICENCGYTE